MNILIAALTDKASDPFRQIGDDYLRRTQRPLIPKIINCETESLLNATQGCLRIALEERGQLYNSIDFARKLESFITSSRKVAFLIGAAAGLPKNITEKCDLIWSLSPLTFPHRLAYCILAEQIYRAGEIIRNGPYHK